MLSPRNASLDEPLCASECLIPCNGELPLNALIIFQQGHYLLTDRGFQVNAANISFSVLAFGPLYVSNFV